MFLYLEIPTVPIYYLEKPQPREWWRFAGYRKCRHEYSLGDYLVIEIFCIQVGLGGLIGLGELGGWAKWFG